MKRYSTWIWTTFVFLLSFLIIAALIGKFIYIGPVYNPNIFKLKSSVKTLIVGASHSATAFDTNFIPEADNVASSGEPLFFTYYKTKALLTNNPQIEKLVVAISPIHIGKYSEKLLFTGNAGSREFTMKYYFLLDDFNDPLIDKLSSDNILGFLKYRIGLPFNYMSDLKVFFNFYTNRVKYTDYLFFGGVERVQGNHVEIDRQKDKAAYYFDDENGNPVPSIKGIEIIQRIASLAESFGVDITIVSTPIHPYFSKLIPANIKNKYDEVIQGMLDSSERIEFIDLSEFELNNDLYLDGDHLNAKGAEKFSKYMVNRHL